METITIPSPSAFLRKSPVHNVRPLPPHPSPIQPSKNLLRRPLASSGEPHTTSAGVHNAGITKPKQSKSRNGCITCKGKRLKCDETKPLCEQCRKRNVQCGGYSKAFKWRSFEEANFTGKSGLKPKKGKPLQLPDRDNSSESSVLPFLQFLLLPQLRPLAVRLPRSCRIQVRPTTRIRDLHQDRVQTMSLIKLILGRTLYTIRIKSRFVSMCPRYQSRLVSPIDTTI